MKIAYVLPTGRGGLPHYTAELANAVSRYAEVTVIKPITTTADDIFSSRVKVISVFDSPAISYVDIEKRKAFSLNNLRAILSYKNIKALIDINPDIVHLPAGLFPPIQIFTRLYKLDKIYPFVITYHYVFPRKLILRGRDVSSAEPLLTVILLNIGNLLSKLLPIKISKIIVHTMRDRDVLIKKGTDPRKITVIPHGCYTIFRSYNTQKGENSNTILFFGNIIASKGIDTLIDAIPIVVKEIPEIKLIIAGNGIIPERSWKIIEKYKLNFEVHNYFIPNEGVGEFFSRANLVVLPYRGQGGYSGVLTIAWSFGKPVVTTNVGEFPVLVRDADCGLVVPPDDPKALAEAIIKLLRDDELRERMGRNALKMAEKLSWDNIAKMHMKVYEEVLNEWRKGN